MKKLFLVFSFPVILFAGNIDLSFKNNNGQSSYTVNSNNTQNLESKLVFPFSFNTIDLEYEHKFRYFSINTNSLFLLNNKTTNGKDYDWQNSNMTVYSQSDNKIDKYDDINIQITRNIFENIKIFTKFNYKILDMSWKNTYQEDYVKNTNEYIFGNTLKFQQEFYKYHVGLEYKNNISKNIFLILKPSLAFAYINTKDTHILRNFYTIQNAKAFGYDINCALGYKLTMKSNLKISISYIHVEDKNTDMDYYNKLNEKYSSYPSSYNYKNNTISIHYNYIF